jgi:DHA1 family bicyclomycin/chloramphenicol resistance-like MFS transporter
VRVEPARLPISGPIILLLGALTAIGPLAIDMYLPAFPAIATGLHTELGAVQITLSVFFAGIALGQLFYGPISDRWGRRIPLLFGLSLFTVASLGCTFAHSIESLTLWRLAMSIGGASGMVVSRAVVRDRCDTRQMAQMFALLMLIMGLAPILAPSLGGLVLGWVGWRGIFGFIAFFGLVCGIVAFLKLEESLPPERRHRGDLISALKTYGGLLKHQWFLVHCLIAGSISGALFGYVSAAPTLFTEHLGFGPRTFSILFGLNAACLVAAAQINRPLLKRYGPRRILLGACVLMAVSSVTLFAASLLGFANLWVTEVTLAAVLASAGLAFPNVGALALAPFARIAGSASALQGSLQFSVGALAGAAIGLLHTGGPAAPSGVIAFFGMIAAGATIATRGWPTPE